MSNSLFIEPVEKTVFIQSADTTLVVERSEVGIAIVEGRQGPAGPGAANSIVWNETPTGSINGANATFTLATAPSELLLHVNGLLQHAGASNDFTLSGATITFNAGAIPQTGDVLLVTYIP